MKSWIKILLPIVGLLYCIAFLEINLPGTHQTWDDQYDTYIATQNNNDVVLANQPVDKHLENFSTTGFIDIAPIIFKIFFFLLISFFLLLYNSAGLYLKNCTLIV
ncbi:MAG TPA: hypothetical protein VKA27_00505 [Sunxiuqinia sp.]|nr:hypothetical protein [Sunxiuqinia sp.]